MLRCACGAGATHYANAPWDPPGLENATTAAAVPKKFLRSVYWSMMTLTTTGHVDVINEDSQMDGEDWEFGVAVVIVCVATAVYICERIQPRRRWLKMPSAADGLC